MSFLPRLLLVLASLLPAAAAQSAPAPALPEQPLAIIGADVLPMTGPERLGDQVVIVRGNRIVAVGPRESTAIPAGARRIDARGLTLMPGLVDMHIHIEDPAGEGGAVIERALAALLAHGVTTARAASGSPEGPELRARIERGRLAGPRLYAGTPHINSGNTQGPAAARARVAEARAGRFDFVKIHEVDDLETWQVLIDESARAGLPTIGHVTDGIGFFRALAAGQQVEHLENVPRSLLPPDSPALRERFGQIPAPHLVQALETVTDADIARLAARTRAAGGYHGPSLALFDQVYDPLPTAEQLLAGPGMATAPLPLRAFWAQQRDGLIAAGGVTERSGRTMRDLRRRVVRAFHAAGVPLLAGSGSPIFYLPFGEGLLRELEAMVATGLTPIEALRTATVIPRDYFRTLPNGGSSLGWRAEFGTIAPGARADLILLRGDPSRDIGALRRLQTVIAAGRLYDRAALDDLMTSAAGSPRR